MEVILQEDFPALGYVGDRVAVRRGYARNYLVPKGIAVEVSTERAKELEHRLKGILAKKRRLKGAAEEFAGTLSQVKIEFKLKVGDKGRSFGSVTSKDIHESLVKLGHNLERKQIRLAEPIKVAGEHKVSVKLHSEVTTEIVVDVSAEAPRRKKKDAAEDAKKSKAKGDDSSEEFEDTTFAEALAAEDQERTEGEEATTSEEGDIEGDAEPT